MAGTAIRYIHTGNINLSSCSEASQLYYTAKKYMLHHLKDHCCNYLHNSLNLENVCQLYEHSQLYEDEVLSKKCINIFMNNTKELLQNSSFTDAELSTVEKIFSLTELNIDSEVDLIKAAALYLSAQGDKNVENKSSRPRINTAPREEGVNVKNVTDGPEQATPGSSDVMNYTVKKQQIRNIVKHIRWLTLTPQQYEDCTARYSLLTPTEDHAVLLNIEPDVPMPSGLSTSRVRRDKVGKAQSEATFRYMVQNLSSLELDRSPLFYVRNLPWQIVARSANKEGIKYLAMYVQCNTESKSRNWSCDANVELRLICHKPGAENYVEKFQESIDWYNDFDYCLIPWDTVLDPTQGYIQDDAVTIEVHVAAEEPQGDI